MTTYSEITITFNQDFALDNFIRFKVRFPLSTSPINWYYIYEQWKPLRSQVNEVTIGTPTVAVGERSAINYINSFNLDHNTTSAYLVERAINVVTIKCLQPNVEFYDADSDPANGATYLISNSSTGFNITSVSISEADSNPCDNVKISVTTNEQSDNITSPISGIVSTNPYVFTYTRGGIIFDVSMLKSAVTRTQKVSVPKLLTTYIDTQIINTPQNIASVNILVSLYENVTFNGILFPLIFEYSLDNVTWQNVNSFTGLAIGNYTAYVRDNIGCSVSVPFEITTFSPNLVDFDPVSRISNLNSIRFKEDATFSNCGTKKLPTNTLSFEERDNRPDRSFLQLVQKCDTLKTQLDTNYETITAKAVDCDGTETALTVSKMTDNMNKTDVRDGTVLIQITGLVGIRFGDGLTYDPTTLITNGSYNLGSTMMSWINVGDYVNLQGVGWTQILYVLPPSDSIPYSRFYTSYVNNGFFTQNQVIQVQSVYNAVDFERYEFSFAALLLSGYYHIKVETTDTNFTDKSFTSEWMWVQEKHQKHFLIDYYNSVNNEINYSTGLRHRIRIPYVLQLKWKPNNTQDLYVTDQNTIQLESRVREFYSFSADPLPTAMAQKVVLALSLDRLFIDGQSYLMEGEPEVTTFGDTNLYQVKATLVKADYVFDTNSNIVNQDIVIDGVPLAIIPNQKGMLFIN